jgi:hypothetical protein
VDHLTSKLSDAEKLSESERQELCDPYQKVGLSLHTQAPPPQYHLSHPIYMSTREFGSQAVFFPVEEIMAPPSVPVHVIEQRPLDCE